MTPSWNFPARAKQRYKGSEPSRAGAFQFFKLSYGSSQLGSDSSLNNSGPRGGGGYMDRSEGRDDYYVSIFF